MSTVTHSSEDKLTLYDTPLTSRLLLGTAQYPSPDILEQSVKASKTEIITVSLRREMSHQLTTKTQDLAETNAGQKFWELISDFGVKILPNTAGCRTVKEAVTTAQMAREVFETSWIKLEIIANDDTLQPDVFGLVEAAKELTAQDFQVFPYMTEDLSLAEKLLSAGCEVLMPWGAPIGSGLGLNNPYGLKSLRAYFPDIPLIVDAGLGAPSHAAAAMELGIDAILLNTAVAKADDPVLMAQAFANGIAAGRSGYLAGLMEPRDIAVPSTPVSGTPFFNLK